MQKVKKSLKSIDIFGKSVGLTYDGEATFQTLCGGLTTLLAFLIVGATAINSIFELINSQNYSMTEKSTIKPYTDQLFDETT